MNVQLNPLEGEFKTTYSAVSKYSFKRGKKIYQNWNYLHLETSPGSPWYKETDIDDLIEFLQAAKQHLKALKAGNPSIEELEDSF